ncbi:hypothetical protein ACV3UV_12215 [Clostridium perfringens]|jgi:hypothetical protein
MGSNYIVVAKYKGENRIVLHSSYGEYSKAIDTKEYLKNLGHIAEVIEIGHLK